MGAGYGEAYGESYGVTASDTDSGTDSPDAGGRPNVSANNQGLTQEARRPTESGMNDHRVHFAREDLTGNPPVDGDYLLYSDVMRSLWEWAPDASVEAQRGVGDTKPRNHFAGPEEHDATMLYDMQKWLVAQDNGGVWRPHDASFDGLVRDANGNVPNSHTVVDRERHLEGGRDGAGHYTYTVGLGGKIDEIEGEAESDNGQPFPMGLNYYFEKVRKYVIHQPSGSPSLVAVSDSDLDTGEDAPSIAVETEGATVSASNQLNGTTPVLLDGDFDSLDAAWIDGYAVGDVTVGINAGDADAPEMGTELVEPIEGRATYSKQMHDNSVVGDRGVPLLGGGTRESEVATPFEFFIGDRIATPDEEFGPRVNASTLSVSNNLERTALAAARQQAIDRGPYEPGLESTVGGAKASFKASMRHLKAEGRDITWYFGQGSLIFPQAVITEPGEYAPEAEEAVMTLDNTFMSQDIVLGDRDGNPVEVPALQ